ncbi:MAG: TIGR02147 family protein [Fibrobacterales bacterium]
MINVFNYTDYRLFIRDFQAYKQNINNACSFRYFSKKADIKSPSFYPQVIKGDRNLTKETLTKTCKAFGLSNGAAEYFENLVFYNQAKNDEIRDVYLKNIIELQKIMELQQVRHDQFEYFSVWYHCAIREAVTLYDFNGDFGLLGTFLKPAITAKQAEDSVQLLLDLGFIEKTTDGYIQSEPLLQSTENRDTRARIIEYQKEMLELAIASLDRWKTKKRFGSVTTMSISQSDYSECVEIIRECTSRIMKLASHTHAQGQVYAINMHLFPLSLHTDDIRGGKA